VARYRFNSSVQDFVHRNIVPNHLASTTFKWLRWLPHLIQEIPQDMDSGKPLSGVSCGLPLSGRTVAVLVEFAKLYISETPRRGASLRHCLLCWLLPVDPKILRRAMVLAPGAVGMIILSSTGPAPMVNRGSSVFLRIRGTGCPQRTVRYL
jgi:hypothetical protein